MKKTAAVVLTALLALSPAAVAQPAATPSPLPSANPEVYGVYPIAYKELAQRWMSARLADPKSASYEFPTPPTAGEYKTQKGDKHVGYIVEFAVSARNQFGLPTGKQRYRVVIRNGEVLWGGRVTR